MALISPILDNRTYEQLRAELIGRIPVYAPEWTDHNESDPGIALLELFAHLGESLLFRFNQIPETTRIEFLRLLGVRPRPAQPAQVLLAAATERAAGAQLLKGTEALAGAVAFETDDEVFAWPLDLLAAGKTPPAPAETLTPQQLESRADALARAGVAAADAQFYTTTVLPDDPLAPDAVPLDVDAQADHALWIALLAKPTTDVTALAGRTLFVGVAQDEALTPPVTLQALHDRGELAGLGSTALTGDPPPMTWRLWNGPTPDGPPFRPLPVIHDTTRGLLTSGVVKLVLPPELPTLPTLPGPDDGVGDAPPRLQDTELAARVIAWIQVFRPVSDPPRLGDRIGRVRWVGINAVQASQARTAGAELLGTGTGDEDQQLALTHQPVLPGTVVLEVEEAAGWTPWIEVDDFAASRPEDRHYMVDLLAGTVSFGAPRVPQIGERIRVLGYRYGGGSVGNVGAKAVTSVSGAAGVTVTNPLPAAGGSDAASLTEALDAIPGVVHRHDRAVIAEDFQQLAAEVAGVARAEPLPRMHPDNPRNEAAGVVSVVVFGPGDPATSSAPLPDLGLLRRVARYLDARRLVTTELYVIPPEYVEISLSVGVAVRTGYQADAVRRWVDQILRQYLAPLPTGGPDGAGWPLGRDVRRAELEAVAVQVDGVEYVEQLRVNLTSVVSAGPSGAVPGTELIVVERWQVPAITALSVSVGAALPLGTDDSPAPPAHVPVPVPVEVC